jgi:hypothetical protein
MSLQRAAKAAAKAILAPEPHLSPEEEAHRERVQALGAALASIAKAPLVVWGARRDVVDVVQYLIIHEPDHVWRYGEEALQVAVERRATECARLLQDFLGVD